MNRKILMVYPEIPNTYWGFQYAVGFMKKKAAFPPLGLLTVAALLPPDYDVSLVDMNVSPLDPEEIRKADMVFISAMIVQKRSFREVVRLCNDLGTPVVAGGPYPISLHEKIEGVDHFVLDEAELTLPVFLEDLENGHPKKVYRDERKPDITTTPVPRFDLIDVDIYHSMPLQYSRGCPFQCEFCDIIEMFGRIQRTKTPEQFLDELDAVYRTGFRGVVFIVDDNFVGNKRKVKEVLRAIVEWQREHDYPFSFNTEASVDLAADDVLLDLMVEAGFNSIFVGIETPDVAGLLAIKKTQNVKANLLESVEKLQRRGLEVTGGFIVGFDTDAEDIFDRQIEFIHKAAMPLAMVGLLSVPPNSQLFRRLSRENRLLSEPSGNNTHDLRLDFETRMPADVLITGYKRILAEIYSPGRYFQRCLEMLKRLPARVPHGRPFQKEYFRAFFLSLALQGFSSYGLKYFGYLLKSLFVSWRRFPSAVTMAVMGHHFFRITREILQADDFSTLLRQTKESVQKRWFNAADEMIPHLIQDALKQILSTKTVLNKEYRKLSHGVQQYLEEKFMEFEGFCEKVIRELNRLTPSSA